MTTTKEKNPVSNPNISRLNLGLVLLAGLLLLLYMVSVNKIADLRYRVSLSKLNLSKQNALAQSFIDAQQNRLQNLIGFAQKHGMIEVKNYDSFFEQNGVALKN